MRETKQSKATWERVVRVIRAELSFYPGRASLMARIVLACTIVMLIIMIFRIPGAALGAYYPLLLSRDNPRATRRSALRTGGVCILGTVEILLGAMFFAASPFLHLLWVAASLFAVFYLISTVRLYDAALALGLLITTGITTWDLPVTADKRLTLTLFTMLSILIGCTVSVVVEYVFTHTHSPDAVLDGIRERLALVSKFLDGCAEGRRDIYHVRIRLALLSTRGTGQLRERLAHANYVSWQAERLGAALSLSDRIVNLASNLEGLDPPSATEDRLRCAAISAHISAINNHLSREEAPGFTPLTEIAPSFTPLLIEIERNVELLSQSLTDEEHPTHYHLPEPGEERRFPLFREDAFTNKEHVRFAVRGMLSAFACYLLYMSVGWTGLGAATATCVLTALGNTGASRHKQLMRFAGVIFGACVIGFATQAVILPQIDSLLAFTILFAFVITLGAWVGTSGPRIAYAGTQIVLAYDLVSLNRFTITTSLTPARDAVLGILLGIFAMWLIFDHLWAKTSNVPMRKLFLSTLQQIGTFESSVDDSSTAAQSRSIHTECERINKDLDTLRGLADFSVFEPYSKHKEEDYLCECIKTLLPQLRSVLLLKAGVLQHELIAQPAQADQLASNVLKYASGLLQHMAQVIKANKTEELGQPVHCADLSSRVAASLSTARSTDDSRVVTQMLLSSSLLNVTEHLLADTLLLAQPVDAIR